MIHLVNFCRNTMGAAGTAVAAVMFIVLAVLGVVIAMRGRETMMGVVSVCAFLCVGGAHLYFLNALFDAVGLYPWLAYRSLSAQT